ncbi:Mitogen-activated protein kinase kinase 4 [Linum perenne]
MCCLTFSGKEFHPVELISRCNGRSVHKVVHRPTGDFFAVKSVPVCGDYSVLESQFPRETELLISFDHPNVVKCHDVVVDSANCEYKILLEFMDGGSLAGKQISDGGQLAAVARQILQGLDYLHGRGVPHWDIKPSNLLRSGHVAKIADFGGSRYLTTIRDHTDFIKTVSYLSPERIDVELNGAVSSGLEPHQGFAGDIWGFGMSVLETYLGRHPIVGGVPATQWAECLTLMRAICEAEPPRAPASAPPELRDFVLCCLRKEPESRWSAAELLKHPFILQNADIPTSVP